MKQARRFSLGIVTAVVLAASTHASLSGATAVFQVRPQGRLYLVEIGPLRAISVQDLREYYRTTLGLEITILPSVSLDEAAQDRARRQYIAEQLIESMKRQIPQQVAGDPKAFVIGVTEADMYTTAMAWQYTFSLRREGRFAMVSAARMLPLPGEVATAQRSAQIRTRKMITKNIGLLLYKLRPTGDPTSILYSDIMSPDDLDTMRESFEAFGISPAAKPRPAPPVAGPPPRAGAHPCFLVRHAHAQATTAGSAVSADIAECLPDLQTEKEVDEVEIDLRNGRLVTRKTDMFVAGAIPLNVVRSFSLWFDASLAFGLGSSHTYEMFPVGSRNPYTWIDLTLSDGSRIRYDRISPGTGYSDAVYEHRMTATRFLKSRIQWNGNGWDLKLTDGTVLRFPEAYSAKRAPEAALVEIRDAAGRAVRVERDARKNLARLSAPGGASIAFEYDSSNRVVGMTHGDRTVMYDYDTAGRLRTVTYAPGHAIRYTYNANNPAAAWTADGRPLFSVRYAGGRTAELFLPDGRVYRFGYSFNDSSREFAAAAFVTAPDGSVTELKMKNGTLVSRGPVR